MGLITLLRGFKVPIAVLDRFLESHGVEATERIPPHLFRHCDFPTVPPLDPQSVFLRARLAVSNPDPASLEAVRLFIPQRRGWPRSMYGYVAYAFVMVLGQRHVELATELPEQAPPGFAELRRDILACAVAGEDEDALHVAGMQSENGFFAVLTEEREFPLERPYMKAVSSLRPLYSISGVLALLWRC